ncbi:MAG: hypothetical protein JRN51_07240 [Nitrososphaerota archaeon]|nr:hypothetical protein [Nitrososphaerota archaeon]
MSSDPLSVFQRFAEAIESDAFVAFEEQFAERMRTAINKGYARGKDEPEIVEAVSSGVNSFGSLAPEHGPGFRIVPESAYIHGFRSQVKFQYRGSTSQCELGDVVYILSITHGGRVFFERATFNQVKKADKHLTWHVKPEQLFLLTSFPTFRGVAGSWISPDPHNWPNLTGCLGSYGLIYDSDFLFVNARDLLRYLGLKKQLNLNQAMRIDWWPPFARWLGFLHAPWDGLGASEYRFAANAAEFSRRFLRFGIGEILFIPPGAFDNPQARSMKKDLRRGIKSLWDSEHWDNKVESLWKSLSLPYVGQDPPDDGEPYPVPEDPDGPGTGVVHIRIEVE